MGRVIYEDTRQHAGKHDRKHRDFERLGVVLVQMKLDEGDYWEEGSRLTVDTKKDIYELSGNLTQQHARFRRECERAKERGNWLVVLVENVDGVVDIPSLAMWREPHWHYEMRRRKSRKAVKISGKRLAQVCSTMTEKYGVRFRFCKPTESAEMIMRYLEYGKEHSPDEFDHGASGA